MRKVIEEGRKFRRAHDLHPRLLGPVVAVEDRIPQLLLWALLILLRGRGRQVDVRKKNVPVGTPARSPAEVLEGAFEVGLQFGEYLLTTFTGCHLALLVLVGGETRPEQRRATVRGVLGSFCRPLAVETAIFHVHPLRERRQPRARRARGAPYDSIAKRRESSRPEVTADPELDPLRADFADAPAGHLGLQISA